ncbi:NAD-dependent protein deacylase [Aquisalimonas sp.]|uniref:SIR2 family NAD-dependent protein deacylase n=1 Tax=Aquisalimonas sp. TaxID=1872621 RepID=UPI0025C71D9D|nr:NAD-dependent protein deacylase [Aquisalimonas sp.]
MAGWLSDENALLRIDTVAQRLATARRALFITGAGLSADSGLPTYRGVGGIYDDGVTEEGIPFEVALSGDMFRRRPELTWKHIARIEAATRGASFNRGHEVLAAFEASLAHSCVLTQNVDGFHQRAGSQNVIEVHGNVHTLRCTSCEQVERVADFSQLREIPPACAHCGELIRPDVVLFGEMLPFQALDHLTEETTRGFDVVMSIGTTSYFPYIVEPVLNAREQGATTVEINPAETEISDAVDFRLPGRAATVLEALWQRFQHVHGHG